MFPVAMASCAGPDDRNDPEFLAGMASSPPLMEIAVQASDQRRGTARYPSQAWLSRFAAAAARRPCRAAVHVNGRWCREMLCGRIPQDVADLLRPVAADGRPVFARVQLNFDADRDPASRNGIMDLITRLNPRRVILQHNEANAALLDELSAAGADFDVLFDASKGLGLSPAAWPVPFDRRFSAYAGGFTPENAASRLRVIGPMQTRPFGIDAESGLRSQDADSPFDPTRAAAFVAEALKWNQSHQGR